MKPTRTERGWAGHFICASDCLFRRNTLIERGRKKIVVSTVGAMLPRDAESIKPVGAFGRYYETMAFRAKKKDGYWEIDASNQIDFESNWSICADSVDKLPKCVDVLADEMHENVVKELMDRLDRQSTEKA
jgi:hypothetical protein